MPQMKSGPSVAEGADRKKPTPVVEEPTADCTLAADRKTKKRSAAAVAAAGASEVVTHHDDPNPDCTLAADRKTKKRSAAAVAAADASEVVTHHDDPDPDCTLAADRKTKKRSAAAVAAADASEVVTHHDDPDPGTAAKRKKHKTSANAVESPAQPNISKEHTQTHTGMDTPQEHEDPQEGRRFYVGGLSPTTTTEEVATCLGGYGVVREVCGGSGNGRGFCFVTFEAPPPERLLSDSIHLNGREIRVSSFIPKSNRPPKAATVALVPQPEPTEELGRKAARKLLLAKRLEKAIEKYDAQAQPEPGCVHSAMLHRQVKTDGTPRKDRTVFVGNISTQLPKTRIVPSIRSAFADCGTVVEVRLVDRFGTDFTGPKMCYVELDSLDSCKQVCEMNGYLLCGAKLRINMANDKQERKQAIQLKTKGKAEISNHQLNQAQLKVRAKAWKSKHPKSAQS
eukprot:NODE_1637_length_1432_cov_27.001533_g1554_i0.p1 GENE.NODE_1637_length_1432_cov_27.001533_g1554_i0~~NODE_1637_length_1432_cov_27.001533_g1554_i0.p1  ORF type:complete len:463 (-),score=115.64 NODE_1637_length_1432_cov_27.001533_g1554_i0:43-1404(-)